MFARTYFSGRYFAPRYWPPAGAAPPSPWAAQEPAWLTIDPGQVFKASDPRRAWQPIDPGNTWQLVQTRAVP